MYICFVCYVIINWKLLLISHKFLYNVFINKVSWCSFIVCRIHEEMKKNTYFNQDDINIISNPSLHFRWVFFSGFELIFMELLLWVLP